ncbi:MAG: hypothetical protein K0S11_620 [Gammaproteobacteria bacterium]|jgi:hypothetical protein|nr:hypothetical protein [Gammaproteobacteria bacterium]
MLMKQFVICAGFALVFLSAGCTTHTQPPKIVKVLVPVKCPVPNIPAKPHLPIADLKSDSRPNDVVQAYAASVKLLQGYSNHLLKLLSAYQEKPASANS